MLELGVMQVALVMVVVVAVAVWRRRQAKVKDIESFLEPNAPKDTVILHQYGPAPHVPSISPFVIKLETYLRAADIPYVNRFDRRPGPKGKLPWIQYNGRAVPDSQFCIEFLNTQRGVELNKNLTTQQTAAGHLIRRTCEESLYWVLLMWRLVFDPESTVFQQLALSKPIIWIMRNRAQGSLKSQGIGRHSEQDVQRILEDDLAAVSTLLDNSKFLFGDKINDVTEYDCAMFGQLSQLVWQMPGTPIHDIIEKQYPNLISFCENMKEAFWPDWDSRLRKISSTKR